MYSIENTGFVAFEFNTANNTKILSALSSSLSPRTSKHTQPVNPFFFQFSLSLLVAFVYIFSRTRFYTSLLLLLISARKGDDVDGDAAQTKPEQTMYFHNTHNSKHT